MRWILAFLSLLFRCLPRRAAHAAGAVLGWIWYYLIPVRRSVARANLRLAVPDKSEKERRKIARGCFVHLARCAVEFLRLPGLNRKKVDKLLEHTGWEHYRQAMEKGRGVIVVTAHFGNFDLLAGAQAVRGLPLHILTREQHLSGFNRYWMSVRAKLGVGMLPVKKSALRIHRLLKDGKVVAMVIDQHAPKGRGVVRARRSPGEGDPRRPGGSADKRVVRRGRREVRHGARGEA